MLPEQERLIENLYVKNFKKFIRYAEVFSGDPSISQDIVQDTFHEAIKHIDILMVHENPDGWLMNVLKNKIRENRRRDTRYARHILSTNLEALTAPDYIDALNEKLSRPNIVELIEKIKDALKPDEYRFFSRFVFDKASHLVVAKEFGITVYASQKRLERIRKKLHDQFPDYVPK